MKRMRKKLTSLALALSLTVAAQAVNLFPNGVLAGANISVADLQADGWTVVYNTGYGSGAITEADIASWATAAGVGGYVFVGGTDILGNVILGATGLASEVLSQTFSNSTAVGYSSSNLFWYNVDNNSQSTPVGSFGFAPIAAVNLYEADTMDLSDPYRLSWHVDFGGGGYRLGSITGLNNNNNYKRVVLVAPGNSQSVPDSTATAVLLGAAVVSLAALRRRF
jgi:hypothetical protein